MIDLVAIVCCWMVSFLFAGIEAGLLSINPVRLRHHAKQGMRGAVRLERLLRHPERLFVTILLITNMADILGLLLLTRRLVLTFGDRGFLAALVIAFPIYLFLLWVLPTALFRRFPFRALVGLTGLLELVSLVLSPFLELGVRLAQVVVPGRKKERVRLFAAREELKQITTESEREGSLTATERAMIHNVVDLRTVHVRDIMIPLPQVVAIRPDIGVEEALAISRTTGVDRLPVVSGEGKPLGLVNALDILLEPGTGKPPSHQMRRMVMTSEDEPAYRALRRLRAARLGLAGVLDGNHNLSGVVTIEDLIRRLIQSA